MKRFLMMFMVLGLIAGPVATAEAGSPTQRTVEGSYGPFPAPITGCNRPLGTFACLIVQTTSSESMFTAKVTDTHGQPVFVEVDAFYEDGSHEELARFCGETSRPVSFSPGSHLEFFLAVPNWPGELHLECPASRIKTTGTISVTLSGGTTSEEPTSPSPEPAESPAPQSSPSGQPEVVERSVGLALRRHLRATGTVSAADASCSSDVPVVIQRKTSDAWLDIASTTTNADGAFAVRLTDRAGRYRAIATEVGTPERTCLGARSATVRHQH